VAAFHEDPAAADAEVLAGVEPATPVHVEVLDAASDLVGRGPADVRLVRAGHVVHEDLDGRLVPDRHDRAVGPRPQPAQSTKAGPPSARAVPVPVPVPVQPTHSHQQAAGQHLTPTDHG
jgi:hypothetical protein